MQLSSEVRWFRTGVIPEQVASWFQFALTGPAPTIESRVDLYLRLLDTETLGVKARGAGEPGSNLELKLRQQSFGQVELAQGVTGNLDHWAKWSFKLDGASAEQPDLSLPAGSWVEVEKTRKTRKYEVPPAGDPSPVEAKVRVPEGCNVELANLVHPTGLWWSFGFEAFGSPHLIRGHLDRVATSVLAEKAFPLPLRREDSFSYSAWLHSRVS